jgi:hypothetical protein
MNKYVMVLKTNQIHPKETLQAMRKELNEALKTIEVSQVINIRPGEEVLLLELRDGETNV